MFDTPKTPVEIDLGDDDTGVVAGVVHYARGNVQNWLDKVGADLDAAKLPTPLAILKNMEVPESARGQGTGRGLVEAFISEAAYHKAKAVILEADLAQENAFPLDKWYQRLGFTQVGDAGGNPIMLLALKRMSVRKNPANQDALYYQHGCRFVLVLPDGSVKYAKTRAAAEATAQAQGAALYALTDTEGRTTRTSTATPVVRQSPVRQSPAKKAPADTFKGYKMTQSKLDAYRVAARDFRGYNDHLKDNLRSSAKAFVKALSDDLGGLGKPHWNESGIASSGECTLSAPEAGLYVQLDAGAGPAPILYRGCSPKHPYGGDMRFHNQWAQVPKNLQEYEQFLGKCRSVMTTTRVTLEQDKLPTPKPTPVKKSGKLPVVHGCPLEIREVTLAGRGKPVFRVFHKATGRDLNGIAFAKTMAQAKRQLAAVLALGIDWSRDKGEYTQAEADAVAQAIYIP